MSFLHFLFLFVYTFVSECVYMHVCVGACEGQKRA